MKRYISLILLVLIVIFGQLFTTFSIQAEEYKLRGVIDIRATVNDTITSFRDGGYGKFDLNNNENLSLAQAGGEFIIDWDSGISAHIIANTYLQNGDGNAGITEGYLKYFSVPNEYGYRWQTKLGIFYPEISLENNAIAWASKNTLNSSTLNTWIGEEIRVLGNEYTLTRLGKYHQNSYDVAFTLGVFVNNDPSGALLAWHGWTLGNRQTLWTEKVTLPPLLALEEGKPLSGKQSKQSDPFYQVGDKIGWHSNLNIKWHKQGKFSLGYYDNNADPYEISEGQYAWRTRFLHLGGEWFLSPDLILTSQYLVGETLMQSPSRFNIVKNDYASAYIALTKQLEKNKVTFRIEEFSVTDKDTFRFDNNNEYGKSVTFNYTYQATRNWFFSFEHNWINSDRPARNYANAAVSLIETQSQIAARFFF